MSYFRSFLSFWYNLIFGDDWTVAVAIAATLALTYWLAHHGTQVWWMLPVVVIVTTGVSTRRAAMQT